MTAISKLAFLVVGSIFGVCVMAAFDQQKRMAEKHSAEYDQGTYVTDRYRLHTVEHDGRRFAVCIGYSTMAMVELK